MEHLDDFIKGKLDQTPIEFNEAHWLQAAELIEQQEQEKRRRFLGWSFVAQFIVFSLLFLFFPLNNRAELDDNGKNGLIIASQMTEGDASSNAKTNSNTNLRTKDEDVDRSETEHQYSKTNSSVKPDVNLDKNTGGRSSITNIEKNSINLLNPSNPRSSTKAKADVNLDKSTDGQSNSTNTEKINTNPLNLSNPRSHLSLVDYLNSEISYLENKLVLEENVKPENYEEKRPFRSTLGFFAASTLYPYTQIGTQSILGYTAGLDFTFNIKNNWSLTTGVYYRIRKGSFSKSQTSRQDSFAFARIRAEHNLTASQLHNVEIPFSLSYRKKRHQVLIGVNYSRLMGLKGSLNVVNNPEDIAPTKTVLAKGWLDDDSFKTNHFDALLGYYFTIKPGLQLGTKAHYTIGSLQNKDTPSDLYLESKPIFIDFGIKYDLINR